MNSSSINFSNISFWWPDGSTVLDDVSVCFSAGRTGLIGANGSGKTTVLRLVSGQLAPSLGVVDAPDDIAYLPQNITTQPGATVADLLGVRRQIEALVAIESGDADERHFAVLGDAWDIETQSDLALRDLDIGLCGDDLGRLVSTLSGGEVMLVAVAGCWLHRAGVTLLDEPTNNLDAVLRQRVVDMITAWPGALIVVSHDVPLLDAMTSTVELHDHKIDVFGGPYSEWLQAREIEQEAAVQAEKAAEFQVRLARRQRAATLERTARNLARGKQKAISEGFGRSARDQMRNTAEAGAGRARGVADERVAAARQALDEASRRVRVEEHVRIDLPDPQVHASKTILELTWPGGQFVMQGPERVALMGRNGVGKTTLIERMLGRQHDGNVVPGIDGRLLVDRVGYLPQRLDLLDDDASPIDNVISVAPSVTSAQVRAQLARLLIRGDAAFRLVGDLSGGERFRVALARLLLATPPAQLLILDEPTNNLDIASVQHLVEAFDNYRGAVLVVSHDARFLSRLGVSVRLELVAEAGKERAQAVTTIRRQTADG